MNHINAALGNPPRESPTAMVGITYLFDNMNPGTNFGIGKIVDIDNNASNMVVGPQYHVLRQGPAEMAWGMFGGIHLPFRLQS